MTQRYTANAKQVLRNGKHFADCIDDGAAQLITEALNERRGMPSVQSREHFIFATGEKDPLKAVEGRRFYVIPEAQQDLPLADNGPLFHRHAVRQEHDEYACSCGRRWDVADGEDHP